MTTLSEHNVCVQEFDGGSLVQVFRSITADLQAVEERLVETLRGTEDADSREIIDFLLASPGKRIRPALVILSARVASATMNGRYRRRKRICVDVAAAVELIHMASLVHDDLIDAAAMRHHRSSVNARWGGKVAVALGDYLCSKAFQLVVECDDPSLLGLLGSGLSTMCEGELMQVLGRDHLGPSESDCLATIERKTAAFFGACCGMGAAVVVSHLEVGSALQRFGQHVGMAFQILDDCRDLLCDQQKLGKRPAQDLLAGDATLPVLYLLRYCRESGLEWTNPGSGAVYEGELARIRELFYRSGGEARILRLIASHVSRAKGQLQRVADSDFRQSLCRLADHLATTATEILTR
jgi:geranylgeranyl pyrophosphate synthase